MAAKDKSGNEKELQLRRKKKNSNKPVGWVERSETHRLAAAITFSCAMLAL
jgi:hypothetical protein